MTARPLSDRDYQSLARFRRALRVFQGFSERAAHDAGLTSAQHQLLLAIRGWDGDREPSVSDLAEALHLRTHSAVELIGRAQSAGLVRTERDQGDQRRQLVRLTPAGNRVLAELSEMHRSELRRFRTEMNNVLRELEDD
jgi:DNA-binding MarR family transcriptional regulator